MSDKTSETQDTSGKISSILKAVQTPLHFFALVLLIAQVLILRFAEGLEAQVQSFALYACLAFFFLALASVFLLEWKRLPKAGTAVASSEPAAKALEHEHDLFVSAPMTSDKEHFASLRETLVRIIEESERRTALKIYYSAREIEDWNQTDSLRAAAKKDLGALQSSESFLLIYPEELPTSALFEAGFALALQRNSQYLYGRDDLPFMLNAATQRFDYCSSSRYTDEAHLERLIVDFVREIGEAKRTRGQR